MGAMASPITSLTTVYSTVHSGSDQRRQQSSASRTFVRGIHRWPVNSPHKWPVTRKMFPFVDVIMNVAEYKAFVSPIICNQTHYCILLEEVYNVHDVLANFWYNARHPIIVTFSCRVYFKRHKVYMHFLSFLDIEMTHVAKILLPGGEYHSSYIVNIMFVHILRQQVTQFSRNIQVSAPAYLIILQYCNGSVLRRSPTLQSPLSVLFETVITWCFV